MKALYLLLFVLLMVSSCTRKASNEYDRLYEVLEQRATWETEKQNRVEGIRLMLQKTKDDKERYIINDKLYEEYMAFKYDSALYYANQNIELSKRNGDKNHYAVSTMHKIQIVAVNGLFPEAYKMLNELDTTALSSDEIIDYYELCVDLEVYSAEYYPATEEAANHIRNVIELRKKIIAKTPEGSYNHVEALATNMSENGKDEQAIKMLTDYLKQSGLKSGSRKYSVINSILGYFYARENNTEKAEHYFIETAISDTKGCIYENTSKRALASLLFDKGEVDQAYQMLNESLNDANFYGTRLRNVQAASLTPKIVSAYLSRQENIKKKTNISIISISVLAALLVIVVAIVVVLLRKYRLANDKAKLANQQLNKTVSQLQEVNGQLKETGKVKEEYLTRYLVLSSKFLDIQDANIKKSSRLIREHKVDELMARLKDSSVMAEPIRQFNDNFDEAFLNIYPNFINELNTLLLPGEQISKKSNGSLPTDVRILALVRLGINDNATIASILRSSITTIYTYRSKFKAKAINKENFEENILQIGL